MPEVITAAGLVIGRAFKQHVSGVPGASASQDDVLLTIQPTPVAIQSGEIRIHCEQLDAMEFPLDSEVDIYIGPKDFAKNAMDKITSQSTEIANLNAELSRLRVRVDQAQVGKVDPSAKPSAPPEQQQPNAPATTTTGGAPTQQTGEASGTPNA